MTENEAIKKHIEECKHRIETIQGYVKRSEDANKKKCEINIYILESTIQALEENQQYHAIGTVEEVQALKEKAEPKKPNYEGDGYYNGELVLDTWICPNCGKSYEVDYDNYDHCPNCGQNIDHSSLTEDD